MEQLVSWLNLLGKKRLLGFICFVTVMYFFYINKTVLSTQLIQTKKLHVSNRTVIPIRLVASEQGELPEKTEKNLFRSKESETYTPLKDANIKTLGGRKQFAISRNKPNVSSTRGKYELECFGEFCNESVPVYSTEYQRSFENTEEKMSHRRLCPESPPRLVGVIKLKEEKELNPPTWERIEKRNRNLKMGGRYFPEHCQARHKVAIIIPLRGRELQLRALLSYMHPIWQRQQIEYTVYTITLAGNVTFNRAKLLNIGFTEANKDGQYDCFVFHDVDLMVENDHCLYWCQKDNPRHLAQYMDKFNYEIVQYGLYCVPKGYNAAPLPPGEVLYFGGVSMLTKEQMLKVNGFSNLYWGWGGEDDDMYIRLRNKGYDIVNPYEKECSYHMIKHEREHSNAENRGRNVLIGYAISRTDEDGLNSLRYKVLSRERMSLYTNITVDIGYPNEKMIAFSKWDDNDCNRRMPWM